MSLFWPPSLRTCDGSRRSSHDRLLLRLYAPPSVELSPRSAGQSRSPLNKRTAERQRRQNCSSGFSSLDMLFPKISRIFFFLEFSSQGRLYKE